jgi:hypothetical protein
MLRRPISGFIEKQQHGMILSPKNKIMANRIMTNRLKVHYQIYVFQWVHSLLSSNVQGPDRRPQGAGILYPTSDFRKLPLSEKGQTAYHVVIGMLTRSTQIDLRPAIGSLPQKEIT